MIDETYLVVATHYNLKETKLGYAKYDEKTDRLVLDITA